MAWFFLRIPIDRGCDSANAVSELSFLHHESNRIADKDSLSVTHL